MAGIEVFSAKMETLTKALNPEVPSSILDLPIGRLVLDIDEWEAGADLRARGANGSAGASGCPYCFQHRRGEIDGVVVVNAYVPESLLGKMESIGRQYAEYKQLKAMKNPIKAGAYLLVAVITVMILFSATWFGFYVARGITVPIQRLAEATKAIAQGDLSVRIQAKATDEIGTLVESFNRMTEDLQGSKSRAGRGERFAPAVESGIGSTARLHGDRRRYEYSRTDLNRSQRDDHDIQSIGGAHSWIMGGSLPRTFGQ